MEPMFNAFAGEVDLGAEDDRWDDFDPSRDEYQNGDEDNDESDEDEEGEETDEEEERPPAPPTVVERQIEGDFDRLVQSIRSSERADGTSGLLNQMWDFNPSVAGGSGDGEEVGMEEQFQNDLRIASGVGRRKGRGKGKGKRRPRTEVVLSHQVRALIGEANQAYVDDDLPTTTRLMLEVLRIEPRAASAWSVLAQVHRDTGDDTKALQLAIMAAHLRHDPDEWAHLAAQSRDLGSNAQAMYCLGKQLRLEPENVEAQWDRAALAKELGDLRQARASFLGILKLYPNDLNVLSELRYVLIELDQLPLCAELYQGAFDYHIAAHPAGSTLLTEPDGSVVLLSGGGFGEMELLVLVDLYNALGQHGRAIAALKTGVRWLSGRVAQRFWDACPDDREFDVEGSVTRDVESAPVGAGNYPISVNARHRLAVARLKIGDVDEGKMHANVILAEDIVDYALLFGELADAFFEQEMYEEARPIYEMLGSDASTSSLGVLMKTAACRRMMGHLKEAGDVYKHLIATDNTNNEAKMQLAEIYEITHEPRKALELVHQVLASRRRRGPESTSGPVESTEPATGTDGRSLFAEPGAVKKRKPPTKAKHLSRQELNELEEQKERENIGRYMQVTALWAQMLAGETPAEMEWLLEAEKMVESFRETRVLFTTGTKTLFQHIRTNKANTETEEQDMVNRLELELDQESAARKSKGDALELATSFRGVTFNDWMNLFMEYAFLLTRRGRYSLAEEVLQHLLLSSAYRSRHSQETIRLALMTCGIHARRFTPVIDQTRKFINSHQFNNEPFRMLLACTASGLHSMDSILSTNLQKHLFREIKLWDAAANNKEMKWKSAVQRWVVTGAQGKAEEEAGDGDGGDDDAEDEGGADPPASPVEGSQGAFKATKNNPMTVALYGMVCLASRSYQSALFYLMHAYDYVPEDPLVCLLLAIASISRAMQRQSDNRHFLITQGAAFLTQYREIRGTDAEGLEEVEYNFGRWFHQLGLLTYAVQHYERALAIVEKKTQDTDVGIGIAREAAFNLALIFSTTGAIPLAEALYERWLTV